MMKSKVNAPVVWSLALGILALGLVGCSKKENQPQGSAASSTPKGSKATVPAAPAAPQGKLNAAEFFTKADAEAVLGKPVGNASAQGDGVYTSTCSYIASDFSGISLLVRASMTPEAFDQAQAASKSISGVDPVPVTGVGEKAYWAGGKLNQLNVLKNQKWLIITVTAGGERSLDLTKKAAEKILPRVP